MGVNAHVLEELTTPGDQIQNRVRPITVAQELHRLDGYRLGRQANSPDIRNLEKRVAQFSEIRSLEARHVPAGNDDVFDLRVRADVIERRGPILGARHIFFLDQLRVRSYRIAARAILAVNGTHGGDQEESLVGIAMHEAGYGGLAQFLERVDDETGMIVFEFGRHRQELAPDRVGFDVRPVDERDDVRIKPNGHSGLQQAGFDVAQRTGGNQLAERRRELGDTNDRILVLPSRVFEFCPRYVLPGFKPLPFA